jgi:outer membrane protein assembly factor BamB
MARRSSLLLVGDWLFDLNADGFLACLEAKTGKEIWRERLGGNFSASPIHSQGRIYCFDEKGKTTVIDAAPKFRSLAFNLLDEGFMASPAVSGKALFLRTKSSLYRIEERR